MPRAGLTPLVVVEEAERMVDELGLEGLTLAGLAERLGVRQPSLYKHIGGVADLHRAMGRRAGAEVAEVLSRAAVGRSRGDAIRAMADAHRAWAMAHPARYPLSQVAPLPEDAEAKKVEAHYLQVLLAVLTGFGITGPDAIDAIRSIRSVLHGFVSLEAGGGFKMPYDLDRSYHRLVGALVDALDHWGTIP